MRKGEDLTRFNNIAIQGTPQMAADKEATSLSRVHSYYSTCNLSRKERPKWRWMDNVNDDLKETGDSRVRRRMIGLIGCYAVLRGLAK